MRFWGMVPGVCTRESPGSCCQWPLTSNHTCHPGVGPPNVRQVSPTGHGVTLQSWLVVTEQRCLAGRAGVTALSGFRISMPVTLTRRGVIGVGSLIQRAMIVLPTMLGRVPSTGVVMFTTACIVSTTPGIHVVVTAGLGRPAGAWSNTCTRGGRVWPAGFGGSVMSKARALAFTLAG